ncbi:lipopolysaccharide biosynthesis protein [Vibrio harveyi]|uniref:lipopolysaccharide biosynthesis protein n=1 Tax=Vibrio harveyi TaxID=669 RepID=UPI0036F199DC
MNKVKAPGERIFFNTIILYMKMLCTIIFSFFTIRYLIEGLGVESYGLYTLITGVVSLLLFLNSAMTTSTQRYLSYYQGTNDLLMQKKIFNHSIMLHVVIGFLCMTILFSVMSFLFNGFLNIKDNLISEAKYLYITTIVTIFLSIVSVPFRATLNAHENIITDSIVLLIQSFLKLMCAIIIVQVVEEHKLIFLGVTLVLSNLLSLVFYYFYCKKKYQECAGINLKLEKGLLLELAHFAWWNLYTNLCYVLNTHGLNVMFNVFFGTIVNAAYGVAFQVNSQIKNLSQSLLRAITPQIMKSEGMTNRQRTIVMSIAASKFGFFLVALGTIPCLLIMEELLRIWLVNVPKHAVFFCKMFLLITLVNQLTIGISPAIQAIGNIKRFQVSIGTIALFSLPIIYLFLQNGYPPEFAFYILIAIEFITGIVKIFIFKSLCDYSLRRYFFNDLFKSILPAFITYIFCGVLIKNLQIEMLYKIAFVILITCSIYSLLFYCITLNQKEKIAIKKLIDKLRLE